MLNAHELSITSFMPIVKSVYSKYNFLISQPKICCRYSNQPSQWDVFERLKRMLNDYHHFTLKNFVYLDLCNHVLNTDELSFVRNTHETWDVVSAVAQW